MKLSLAVVACFSPSSSRPRPTPVIRPTRPMPKGAPRTPSANVAAS